MKEDFLAICTLAGWAITYLVIFLAAALVAASAFQLIAYLLERMT